MTKNPPIFILVADTETTGLSPSARVCEFAYALCAYNYESLELSVVSHGSSLINPGVPIPAEVSKIHGITDDMVQNAPTLEDYIASQNLDGTFDYVGGHNYVRFDSRYLPMLKPVEGHIDTLWACRSLYPNISHKLLEVAEHVGAMTPAYDAGTDTAHRAGYDTAITVSLLAHLLKQPNCWQALTTEPLPTKMPFGKYKGKTFDWIKNNDPQYIHWYANEAANPDARILAAMKKAGCQI